MMLNDEQKKILGFVFEGKTNWEIGDELGYSPNTIKKKLKAIYKFYKVENRMELFLKTMSSL